MKRRLVLLIPALCGFIDVRSDVSALNISEAAINHKKGLKMTAIKNARDVRSGWGINVPNDPSLAKTTAAALNFIGTRWVRMQFDGDTSPGMAALQAALVAGNYPDPNLKLQLLLNDYMQNAAVNTWNNQKGWILNSVYPIKGANGKSVLSAIEGPNEINSKWPGGGPRGPNDTIDKSGGGEVGADNPTADANFVDWAQQLWNFKNTNSMLNGVELLSPTVLYFYPSNWSSNLNVSQYVDYGTFHYYSGINGTSGVPSYPPNPDNFAKMYSYALAGICPSKSLVQSEGGFSSEVGGGYGQDGRSGARYQLMQIFDHHAVGGHRYMIYNMFNNGNSILGNISGSNEDNFGQYYGDYVTPKFSAVALHNLSNLLSLNNNYADPANFNDTASFLPGYDSSGFSVSGIQNEGSAGSSLIMPKSDGSTMIAVWNEPTIDTGSGTSTSPSANNITVNFGSSQKYNVYDPTGGGNAVNFTAIVSTTPIASSTGSSVNLTLYGTPLLIELVSKVVVPVKRIPTSLSGKTITKTIDTPIGDINGNAWSLVDSSNGLQIAINGVADVTTGQVICLTYVNGLVWQQNINKMWWSKSSPQDVWSPPQGTSIAPIQIVVPNVRTLVTQLKTGLTNMNNAMLSSSSDNQTLLKTASVGLNSALTALQSIK